MISKKALSLKPYTAGEQPQDKKYIKLNTNENPYSPSPTVKTALYDFDYATLRLYPDPTSLSLRIAIAKKENVGSDNIFVGNGSDEILGFAFRALLDDNIAFADITYSFYPVFCNLFNISYNLVPLSKDFEINTADYINKKYGGIVIANPNAPTSISLPISKLEELIKKVNCNVIVDEAYIDFSTKSESVASLTKKYNNLLVVKTFSKSYSLAGIRCGYCVGNAELIEGLNRVKDSFNSYPIDKVCEVVASASISDSNYFESKRQEVIFTRQKTIESLKKIDYFALDSDANFLFVKAKDLNGKKLYEYLKNNGVLVRHFDKPLINNFIRVTIGKPSEMERFIELLKDYK